MDNPFWPGWYDYVLRGLAITTGVLLAMGAYSIGRRELELYRQQKFQRRALRGEPVTPEGQLALPMEYER